MKGLILSILITSSLINPSYDMKDCLYMKSVKDGNQYIVYVKDIKGNIYSYYSDKKDHQEVINCFFIGDKLSYATE